MGVHVGDTGTVLQFTITDNGAPVNLAGLGLQLILTKPSGVTLSVVPVVSTNGADGNVQYVTQAGDLNEPGYWQYRAIISSSGFSWSSDVGTFEVLANTLGWQLEMLLLLRNMISDITPPYTYPDTRLKQLILTGAQLMQGELNFPQTYNINIAQCLISPDPTLTVPGVSIRNDSFINLSLLKAACIVDNAEARLAAARGVSMRDADKSVDLRSVSEFKVRIWEKGWCQNYLDARFEYMAGNAGGAGTAIIGPFRYELNMPPGPWTPDGGGSVGGYAAGGYNLGGMYGRYR